MYTQNEVMDFIKEEDVKFIRLAFITLDGKQKNISIMPEKLSDAFTNGISFDASSIEGFQTPDKSDMFLHPDPSTLSIIPWRPASGKVVRMFCDIKYPDGTPYEKDCRYLLKQAMQKARNEYNVNFMFGSEVEFYLFNLDENGKPTKTPFDNAGYMDIAPEDKGENIRRDICFTLEQMGITVEASHHEEGPGQNEIDFQYDKALTSADNTETFKWIVRTKAQANGLFADFSPKPFSDKAGSGMHINISCRDLSGKSLDYTKQMIAGILKHIKEMTFFLNPCENSYNRLGKNKAPDYISWAKENRSTLIRIPASKNERRLELRSPDPMANPYLAFTLLIHACLEGISQNLAAPEPTEENIFTKDLECQKSLETLPASYEEAKKIALSSDFVKNVLGQKLLSAFI